MTTKYHPVFSSFIGLLFCLWQLSSFGQDTSSTSINKKIIMRYFDEVINTQNLNRMGKFFITDHILHTMDGRDVNSREDSSHIAMIRQVYKAIPDVHWTLDHVVAEGDMVAINTTITGTAKGETFGLPGVQKKVRFKEMFFYRLKNNKITEEWELVDIDGLKAQLAKQ